MTAGRFCTGILCRLFWQVAQVRSAKASAYSAALAPFRKDIQCGCCGERLYWHGKTNQWHCRQCRMWSAPIEEVVLSEEIIQRLKWLQENSLQIRAPDTHSVVKSMDSARLDREIQRKIATDKFDEDDLVAAILHRAEQRHCRGRLHCLKFRHRCGRCRQ